MNKICLSIEQMQKLQELGVETEYGSLCWVKSPDSDYWLTVHDENCYEMGFLRPIPTLTLQDMLEKIPSRLGKKGKYFFSLHKIDEDIHLEYSSPIGDHALCAFYGSDLDAAYNMLVWLAENGYLKKKAQN